MRVLVTRPRRDAERTADALRAHGHTPVISPVLEIVSTGTRIDPSKVEALLATSAHAFEFSNPTDMARLSALSLFVVGARTADAAQRAGLAAPKGQAATAARLVPVIVASLPPSTTLTYLAGADRKPDLESALRAQGFEIVPQIVYEARAATALTHEASADLRDGRIDAVLHYSPRSAELFAALVREAGLEAAALRPRHICISQAAAAPLTGRIAVAATPDAGGLFAALEAV